MRERFVTKNFRADAVDLIETMNGIIDEYDEQGLTLTLRQLYYQLVSRDVVPNTEQSYKRVGGVLSDARLAPRENLRVQFERWQWPCSVIGTFTKLDAMARFARRLEETRPHTTCGCHGACPIGRCLRYKIGLLSREFSETLTRGHQMYIRSTWNEEARARVRVKVDELFDLTAGRRDWYST